MGPVVLTVGTFETVVSGEPGFCIAQYETDQLVFFLGELFLLREHQAPQAGRKQSLRNEIVLNMAFATMCPPRRLHYPPTATTREWEVVSAPNKNLFCPLSANIRAPT
jgi:hypothetical protein